MAGSFGLTPLATESLFDHATQNADASWTLYHADGSLVSIQPGGTIQSRPAGTAPGAYEKCALNATTLLAATVARFNPGGLGTPVYAFSLGGSVYVP